MTRLLRDGLNIQTAPFLCGNRVDRLVCQRQNQKHFRRIPVRRFNSNVGRTRASINFDQEFQKISIILATSL